MKKISVIFFCLFLFISFSSCGDSEKVNPAFFRKVARETFDDGWVYTFVYEDYKDEKDDDSSKIKYSFYGFNIRYRYNEKYISASIDMKDDEGNTVLQKSQPSEVLIFGEGSKAQAEDMKLVDELLDQTKSVEDLLALNPEDYKFKELDKDMFFRLMRTALQGEPQKEGEDILYWEKPSYAFFFEPEYIDGYKFQIAFLQETGCVDELYIDVLYKKGDGKTDYIQLSDLVEDGKATEEQKKAFDKIREITEGIKENEIYIYNAEAYKNLKIADIDFSRLYAFLENIHNNKFEGYV